MPSSSFDFVLNGRTVRVDGACTNTSLLSWLRNNGYTGSKEGCAEGDCGACTVALVETNARGERTYRAINSCITLVPMVAGREVVTVEGVAFEEGKLHPVQQAMVDAYGSQCGYCTPGFVVSMFEAYYRKDLDGAAPDARAKIGDQLNGNLCRCTGYRPIREAMENALHVRSEATKEKKDDLFQLRLSKNDGKVAALDYQGETSRAFLRPTSLAELLEIKAKHREKAELVAGATEIGVYINKAHRRYDLLVSTEGMRELAAIEKTDAEWRVGGAATLTALEEALAGEYPMIDKMLWAFASRQIRNRATLAGNIVTASPIGDMPPVMLALDAKVVLAKKGSTRTVALADFFLGYRKTVLEADEVVQWITFPRATAAKPGTKRRQTTYKVSKRRELDISITAAAFVVETDASDVVTHARLAYGGVAATPSRATKTEAFLVGKPWSEATIAAALPTLSAEFTPIDDHRSKKEFRQDLVTGLFEKFFRGEESDAQDRPITFERAEGSCARTADDSRALDHESAVGHVTGGALYVDDVARRRDMLEIWPVVSPHARARITSIDASAALAEPGVVCVLTAKDVPGMNDVGAVRHDEPLFADGEVFFHGQVVAMVVGKSADHCRRAAEKVKVGYEPMPAILGARNAVAKESFHTLPHVIKRGDVASAIAKAPHTLSGDFELGGQEHFYLESHAAWAEAGEDGEIFVCSSTQHPTEVQAVVGHVLDRPRNKVIVQAPRMGGGFGGKETQGNGWAAYVALASVKTGKPVRTQLDRDIDMQITGKRHPFYARFEVGFDGEGRLLGLRVDLFADGGWALDLSESICDRGLFHLDNAYYLPSCELTGRVCKTNVVSHTAFRGFGGPQGMLVTEEILDRVARTLGLLPEVVRERNLYRGSGESNTTHYGQELGDERIPHIWSMVSKSSELAARRAEIKAFNEKSVRVKRGIAITPVKFGISFTATWLNQAGALVLVYRDGSVQVNHGGTEMGQGLYTKLKGVAMRELGVTADAVRVMKTQTDKVPNTSATAASSGSDLNGQAVKAACETIRERIAPVAAELLSAESSMTVPAGAVIFENGTARAPQVPGVTVPFERVVERAYMKQIQLSANGFYRTPSIGYDKSKGKGKPFYYFAYGAAVSEVEIDGWTGMKRVTRVDIVHDVGESLNPGVDRGQIEGAFVQGMGWLTGEELLWSKEGRLLTHSASTYQIPSIGDCPERMNVELYPNAAQPGVIHGSKAVGEPPLMLAISVREAIRDAIAAFGAPGGEVPLASPATHEAILGAVKARLARSAGGKGGGAPEVRAAE
ncbi:MAG: xanthine dehydrogenase molybdopterin binding subunit [Deltaproteobacteria bacterium]|nr:xanthine dehydrogenase molybdopterin binding subunit [Deltaproteobacteria bacterium]